MGGAITIKDPKKAKRIMKALTRKQTRDKADAQTAIPGAGERLEKMERQIAKLKEAIAGQEVRIQKLVAFHKKEGDQI